MYPEEFLNRMRYMLGGEYEDFLNSLQQEKYQALRVNTLKTSVEEFLEKAPFTLKPVPWAVNGYYYNAEDQPGRHPYHEAGIYYIQEPSAMAPAGLLEARPGDRILDLCAAPGGKSTQIAADMKGMGILVCNEIHPGRAKILSENVERMGIRNAMVTNETPQRLKEIFPGYFDKILVDAPCSGEGMFRKNEEARREWSPENVQLCAGRQDEILDCAAGMLRPGGRLVYSTCTFAPEENEGTVSRFIGRHPEFRIEEAHRTEGMKAGIPRWAEVQVEGLEHTVRLWPHKIKGEGHFAAVLSREGDPGQACRSMSVNGVQPGIPEKECGDYIKFRKSFLKVDWEGLYVKFGEQLYLIPEDLPSIKGLKVLRPGLHLGTMKKNRFEPSHALALALKPEESVYHYNLSSQEPLGRHYFRGDTFASQGEKGWYLITVDGYAAGWGKLAGGIMKNHYPKGLRIM